MLRPMAAPCQREKHYDLISFAPQDKYTAPFPSRDCIAIRYFNWIPDLALRSTARPE